MEHTPTCTYSDRLIPSRAASNLGSGLDLLAENTRPHQGSGLSEASENEGAYVQLLRSELLGIGSPPRSCRTEDDFPKTPERCSLFRYKSSPSTPGDDPFKLSPVAFRKAADQSTVKQQPRRVCRYPFLVLDVPHLEDNFYLSLLDWSSRDLLAVGLGSGVYVWNARTHEASKLCDVGLAEKVTSMSWVQSGAHIALGTNDGNIQIWDAAQGRKLRTMTGHKGRVGTLAWNSHVLSSGGRDHHIYHRDVRQPAHWMSRLTSHRQEVCGLRWSHDFAHLASGENAGHLYIWSLGSSSPVIKFTDAHSAAVRALSWSPHRRGLLASGGGTEDRCIRIWNTTNSKLRASVPTGSQVCNLLWSENVNEILSTHGYSLHEIVIWNFPSMSRVARLIGHHARVLQLAASPDGRAVATAAGAGDETLRLWSAFPAAKRRVGACRSLAPTFDRTIR